MTETNIALLSRVVESSPVIVLVCFFFIGLLLRWHYRMEERLKQKDDQIMALQRETLQAMHDVRDAVRDLTGAIRSAR
ncbi:hypothetical protein [Elioraea sp.]|jgi:hypothetical protein|uniref:hypothetical protein n=1 Tax=Elioraea sp. TaxID=2185103 RepID=UPI0021DC260E|nr:hypothetical protein [Elioraea sp.]GIX11597.1 MAG: hypothetical protein KatS3mg116_3307 [Elioraea sp.]